jgi:hypothetical protein
MFFLGFVVGATLMVAAANLAKNIDQIKDWNNNKE